MARRETSSGTRTGKFLFSIKRANFDESNACGSSTEDGAEMRLLREMSSVGIKRTSSTMVDNGGSFRFPRCAGGW